MKLISILLVAALGASASLRASNTSPDPERTRRFMAVVQSDAALEARARALQQLALVASPEAVAAVSPLLGHPELGQYARDVLERMPDAIAGEALRAALSRLSGRSLIGVVNSLGVRRDPLAVDPLRRFAVDGSSPVAGPALSALGRIATPEAIQAVKEVALRGPDELRGPAAEAALLSAERLLEQGRRAEALALYSALRNADVPRMAQLAAIRGAILESGSDGLGLLVEQLRSSDADCRDIALLSIRDLTGKGVLQGVISELERFDPEMQARLIPALVDRREPGVLESVEARARSGNEAVRLAAIRGLGKIGQTSSIQILLEAVRRENAPEVTKAALAALATLPSAETDAVLLRVAGMEGPALQIQLLGVLGDRRTRATAELLRFTEAPDLEVAKAAWRALSVAATPTDLPGMIKRALEAHDASVGALAERAIVATAMKASEPSARIEPVLDAFRSSTEVATKAALLRPLGALVRLNGGSRPAFRLVQAALKDPSEALRTAALQCLADWPDATPTTTLLGLANQEGISPESRETALRGAIRMTANVASGRERSPLNVMESFVLASRVVRTRGEKLLIVSGLGQARRADALSMLQVYLEDPEVQPEAALAIIQIAEATPGSDPAGRTKALLERVLALPVAEELRLRAAQVAGSTAAASKKERTGSPRDRVAEQPSSPEVLFNGRDLVGWDGDPAIWHVRDGLIVGGWPEGIARSEFLATRKQYRNFVLRLDYRLTGSAGCNGGVQFRSLRHTETPGAMIGYQADIGKGYSGSLYDEGRRKRFLARAPAQLISRLEKPGDWNHYEIRCEGRRVELRLNGELTVSYVEEDSTTLSEGLIALQIHGTCKGEIAFRNVTLAPLP